MAWPVGASALKSSKIIRPSFRALAVQLALYWKSGEPSSLKRVAATSHSPSRKSNWRLSGGGPWRYRATSGGTCGAGLFDSGIGSFCSRPAPGLQAGWPIPRLAVTSGRFPQGGHMMVSLARGTPCCGLRGVRADRGAQQPAPPAFPIKPIHPGALRRRRQPATRWRACVGERLHAGLGPAGCRGQPALAATPPSPRSPRPRRRPTATRCCSRASTHVINPLLMANLPYDSEKDFLPVATLIKSEFVLVVHPSRARGQPAGVHRAGQGPARPDRLRVGRAGQRATTSPPNCSTRSPA